MTLKEIFNIIISKDLHEIYVWMNWFAKKNSCDDCVSTNLVYGKTPNCLKCIPSTTLIKKRFRNTDDVDGTFIKEKIINNNVKEILSRKKEKK